MPRKTKGPTKTPKKHPGTRKAALELEGFIRRAEERRAQYEAAARLQERMAERLCDETVHAHARAPYAKEPERFLRPRDEIELPLPPKHVAACATCAITSGVPGRHRDPHTSSSEAPKTKTTVDRVWIDLFNQAGALPDYSDEPHVEDAYQVGLKAGRAYREATLISINKMLLSLIGEESK
jgi:hypothetical protein